MSYVHLSCHRHGVEPVDHIPSGGTLSDRLVSFSYMRGRDITSSEGLEVRLKMTPLEAATYIRPGNWLVLRSATGQAFAFGYVDDVVAGVSRSRSGELSSNTVTVRCISWFELLSRARLYAPMGQVQTIGAMFFIGDWGKITQPISANYVLGHIGWSLQSLFQQVARIRFPESMGGEYIGDAIPIVYDQRTRELFAPNRVIDSVGRTGGNPQTFAFGAIDAGIGEFITNAFVPDRNLVEMFSSLEEGGTSPWTSALARFLGRRPVVIYRVPPWRVVPLAESAIATQDFRPSVDHVVDSILRPVVSTLSGAADTLLNADTLITADLFGPDAAEVVRTAVEDQLSLLRDIYNEKTWDYSRAIRIYPEMIKSASLTWSDTSRVNITTSTIAAGSDTGIEAAEFAGLPITNDESILNHGPRIQRPNWPFIRTIGNVDTNPNRRTNTLVQYIRAVAAQLMQFVQNAHLMAHGQLDLTYADALDADTREAVTYIPAGEIIGVALAHNMDILYAYTDSVVHSYSRSADGSETADTKVAYVRGLFGVEERILRNPSVPLSPVGAQPARQPASTSVAVDASYERAQAALADALVDVETHVAASLAALSAAMADAGVAADTAAELLASAVAAGEVAVADAREAAQSVVVEVLPPTSATTAPPTEQAPAAGAPPPANLAHLSPSDPSLTFHGSSGWPLPQEYGFPRAPGEPERSVPPRLPPHLEGLVPPAKSPPTRTVTPVATPTSALKTIKTPTEPVTVAIPSSPLSPLTEPRVTTPTPRGLPIVTRPAVVAEVTSAVARSIIVAGEAVAVPFAVVQHLVDISNAPYKRAKQYRADLSVINNAFVHYNVGSVRSTGQSLRDFVQKKYNGTSKPFISTHFAIDADGKITQILDCAIIGAHVDVHNINDVSIGIDLINPFCSGKAQQVWVQEAQGGRDAGGRPIMYSWRILNQKGRTLSTLNNFFGPTTAQLASLRSLLQGLNSVLGIPLYHSAGTTEFQAFQKFSDSEITTNLAHGGVWHHAQFQGNRADSIGTNLTAVVGGGALT
jgi:hypothetical protein